MDRRARRPSTSPKPGTSASGSLPWAAFAGIAVAVLAAYAPVLGHGFVWDDDKHVTAPALRSLSGLARIWFDRGATQQYYPLLHSTFWFEHKLWGGAALGYHLVNVLLHAGAAGLFLLVLRRLAVPGAALASFAFALHPVAVESVAWISEQKNTLSTILYLGAALAWLRFDETRARRTYALAFLLYGAALLTKSVTATLPAALLVVQWWRRGELSWRRDVVPLLPWFALGLTAGLHTAWVERKLIGAEGAAFAMSAAQRLQLAGRAPLFYLGKLLWPSPLVFIYPRWSLDGAALLGWLPLVAGLALTVGLWWWRNRSRAPLAAWLFYVGTLFPVLGFLNVYPFRFSFVADHFQYLASLGLFALLGATMAGGWALPSRRGLVVVSLSALAALTFRQAQIYRDSSTLFRATVAANPECWMAWNILGREAAEDRDRLPEAIGLFERALAVRPKYPEALTNVGLALAKTGRVEEALARLEEAIRLEPEFFAAHNNYAIALVAADRLPEAHAALARAVQIDPRAPVAHQNWGEICRRMGREAEAAEHFAEAKRLREAVLK